MENPEAESVSRGYEAARALYAQWGVSTEAAMESLSSIPLSLNCWQGDDVGGFENAGGLSGGGIQATGSYPGKARSADELRGDLGAALSLIPGPHRVNLHAIYAETGGRKIGRDRLSPEHFSRWISWAKEKGVALDFNGTFFSHPMAESGFTLSSRDKKVRDFWVEHAMRCREIGEAMGKELASPCLVNLWIPDGSKDIPVDRHTPRALLKESLDKIFDRTLDPRYARDAVEGKLFGIGSESYVVGSHEFYIGYAMENGLTLTVDMGHFHPTESVADKISSLLLYLKNILLHVSRGVRWDSDHVVILDDAMRAVAEEVARAGAWKRVGFALDYFDASINRVAAWVIGARAALKALLIALLEPADRLMKEEGTGNLTARLALLEEAKALPFGAVWDTYCISQGVPSGARWLEKVTDYERTVLSHRR
jgi:L-rhamnose isomerase